MELATDYAKHRKNGDIVGFLGSLRDICNGSDDGELSYQPFKAMVAVKSLNLFLSQDVSNVHYFKKELKQSTKQRKPFAVNFPLELEFLYLRSRVFPVEIRLMSGIISVL